jgi:hypothetical protein
MWSLVVSVQILPNVTDSPPKILELLKVQSIRQRPDAQIDKAGIICGQNKRRIVKVLN